MTEYKYKGLSLEEIYQLPYDQMSKICREIEQDPLEELRFIDANCRRLTESLNISEPFMPIICPEIYN